MILKTLEILQKVKNNELTIEQAQKLIEQPLDYATIDYNRKKRTGNNEVIYGAGKTKEQIIGIVKDMLDHDIHSILITRVDQEKSEAILKEFPQMIYDSLSHICYIDEDQKEINKGKPKYFRNSEKDNAQSETSYRKKQYFSLISTKRKNRKRKNYTHRTNICSCIQHSETL